MMGALLAQDPGVEVFVPSGPSAGEGILIALVVLAVLIGVVTILGPLAKALARRIEGKGTDAALAAEFHELRGQLAEMDGMRDRILDLEERLDFAERLLAQRPEAARLPESRAGS